MRLVKYEDQGSGSVAFTVSVSEDERGDLLALLVAGAVPHRRVAVVSAAIAAVEEVAAKVEAQNEAAPPAPDAPAESRRRGRAPKAPAMVEDPAVEAAKVAAATAEVEKEMAAAKAKEVVAKPAPVATSGDYVSPAPTNGASTDAIPPEVLGAGKLRTILTHLNAIEKMNRDAIIAWCTRNQGRVPFLAAITEPIGERLNNATKMLGIT